MSILDPVLLSYGIRVESFGRSYCLQHVFQFSATSKYEKVDTGQNILDMKKGMTLRLLVAGLLAISPAHLYFSQEARAFAFSCFLAALSSLLIWRVQRNPRGKGAWIGLALLTAVGLYSTYSYLTIAIMQMAYLAICFPKSRHQYT